MKLLFLEIKRLLRDRINLIFLILIWAATIYGLYTESVTAMYGFRFLHQGMIWWAMFSAFRLASKQKETGISEWIEVLPKEHKRPFAQLVALSGLYLVAIVGIILCVTVDYVLHPMGVGVLYETIISIILYYFLSMIVVGTIGWILGKTFPRVLGYILTAILGYLFGAMGNIWLVAWLEGKGPLLSLAPTFGFPVHSFLYDPLKGYDLGVYHWLKRLFWCIVALVVVVGMNNRRKNNVGLIVLLILGIAASYGTIATDPNLNLSALEPKELWQMDNMYYAENEEINYQEPAFGWKTLKLHIEPQGDTLLVKGEGTIEFIKSEDKIEFNLQHIFPNHDWTVDDISVIAEQNGDTITLESGASYEAGDKAKVSFVLDGRLHSSVYVSGGAAVLPANYQWYPVPMGGQSILFRHGSFNAISQNNPFPMDVELQVISDKPHWSNIKEGYKVKNIAVVIGNVNTVTQDGVEYVYLDQDPVVMKRSYEQLKEGIDEVAEGLNIQLEEITTLIDVDSNILPKYGSFGANSFIAHQIIYRNSSQNLYPPLEEGDPDRHAEFFYSEVLAAVLATNPVFQYVNEDIQSCFFEGYVSMYAPYTCKYIRNEEFKEFLNEEEPTMEFYRNWYHILSENPDFSDEDLRQLMDEWRAQ